MPVRIVAPEPDILALGGFLRVLVQELTIVRDSRDMVQASIDQSPARYSEMRGTFRIISWNLLRLVGAGVKDVAELIERHRPDLLFMQEATAELARLPDAVGGHLFREPMDGRIYGLAVWSTHPLPRPRTLALPASKMPGRVPRRVAQISQFAGITFANVHLSHGQLLNRRQLLHVVRSLEGPAIVIGDYNALGPVILSGFRDVGPRQKTHSANKIISFRLDRCLSRGLDCSQSQVLDRGPSDHHPILLDLSPHAGLMRQLKVSVGSELVPFAESA
jgi:endonuclease/exonuclease/phosphatase (EEP) superfamily protein YafD